MDSFAVTIYNIFCRPSYHCVNTLASPDSHSLGVFSGHFAVILTLPFDIQVIVPPFSNTSLQILSPLRFIVAAGFSSRLYELTLFLYGQGWLKNNRGCALLSTKPKPQWPYLASNYSFQLTFSVLVCLQTVCRSSSSRTTVYNANMKTHLPALLEM